MPGSWHALELNPASAERRHPSAYRRAVAPAALGGSASLPRIRLRASNSGRRSPTGTAGPDPADAAPGDRHRDPGGPLGGPAAPPTRLHAATRHPGSSREYRAWSGFVSSTPVPPRGGRVRRRSRAAAPLGPAPGRPGHRRASPGSARCLDGHVVPARVPRPYASVTAVHDPFTCSGRQRPAQPRRRNPEDRGGRGTISSASWRASAHPLHPFGVRRPGSSRMPLSIGCAAERSSRTFL
jgi:hypothetical protein